MEFTNMCVVLWQLKSSEKFMETARMEYEGLQILPSALSNFNRFKKISACWVVHDVINIQRFKVCSSYLIVHID